MRTIPHSIVSGLLALALTLTAAPAPALATAPDDIVFSQAAHGDDPGYSEDLPIPEEDPAGAKIGAVCYPTLSDALAAAVSGDTITLLEDAVLDGSGLGNTKGVLTLTQDLTIDGGGHTLTATGISYDTGSGGGPNLINVEEGARVILRDLTIDGGSQAKNGLNLYDSTAVLENVTVENCRWYAVVCNGSALEIHGLTPGATAGASMWTTWPVHPAALPWTRAPSARRSPSFSSPAMPEYPLPPPASSPVAPTARWGSCPRPRVWS